jgi:integrase
MKRRAHGDGTIDERGEGKFRLRYRVNGKRFAQTFTGSISEARKELRRLVHSGDVGEHVAPDKVTLAEWVQRWLALLERQQAEPDGKRRRGLVHGRTLEGYSDLMRCHVVPTLGARPIQQIQPSEIDELYIALEKKLAPRTVHHVHTVLGACFKVAVKKGLRDSNPVARAEAPVADESDRSQVLEEDQLRALVDGFRGSVFFPIVAVAAFTGARRNEVIGLRWSDLDAAKRMLRIERAVERTRKYGLALKEPKNKRHKRTIEIAPDLVALLVAERERHLRVAAGVPDGADVDLSLVKLPDGALMFPNPPLPGERFSFTALRGPDNVTKEFTRRSAKLGFARLRLHDLRGTHETMLLDRGVPVHVVAARCGHDPAVLLRTYAKRTRKADTSASDKISELSGNVLAAR